MSLVNYNEVNELIKRLRELQKSCERETKVTCKDGFDKGWKRANERLAEELDEIIKEFV